MNKYKFNFLSLRRSTLFLSGLFLIFFGGSYFANVSAEKESLPEQNLVLGKLTYSVLVGTFSGPQLFVRSSNADGTGVVTLTDSIPPSTEPTWSPDGTKIAYVASVASNDIYVMNANGTNKINLTNTMNINEANPSWSSAGKIVYERNSQIWIMNADGTNQMQFAGITQPSPSGPVWSADGTKIAFSSGGEIWTINADGTNEQRVTMNATADTDPSWSADGTKIVFAKGGSGIAVINANGTNEMNLTNIASDTKPSWSPDGTTIAFRRDAAPKGIYLVDAAGGNQVRVIADSQTTPSIFEVNDNPAWQPVAQTPNTFTISGRIVKQGTSLSGVIVNLTGTTNAATTTDGAGNYQFSGLAPGGNYAISPSLLNHYFTPPNRSFSNLSGNQIADFTASAVCIGTICAQNGRIAFVRDPGEIYTANSDGTDLINITNNAATDTSPNYSPDGTKIIFSTNRDGNFEIYRMNADGSNPVRLTNNPASDISPEYSYDGASIVFVSNRDGNDEIYKMNADGTNQVRLTNDSVVQNVPAFSPDGQKIIFVVALNQLWQMNADGTNQQQFPNPAGQSHYYNHPAFSPNGQKIIFNYGSDITNAQTWTMNPDGTNRVNFPFNLRSPSYSPDGLRVVGSNPFINVQGIYTVYADGSDSLRITTQFDTLPDWQPIAIPRRTAFDFDGDGKSDIAIFRPSTSDWWYLSSINNAQLAVQWGLSTDVLAPADYDGDLKTDFVVWRPSNGNFYIFNSFNSTVRVENFGLSGDIPVGGDWDGDSKADVAVYRPGTQSVFYYRGSMGNPQQNITFIPWGISGDKPVAGDYDGDGRTDAAIYRNGIWYVRRSTDGQLFAYNFGLANDTLVPADYDADGKSDLAVYRAGIWYILRSTQGFTAFQFGISSDTPTPADYDGDGRADAAVFRDGVWWILKSQTGAAATVQFGFGTDKPIQSAFVR